MTHFDFVVKGQGHTYSDLDCQYETINLLIIPNIVGRGHMCRSTFLVSKYVLANHVLALLKYKYLVKIY